MKLAISEALSKSTYFNKRISERYCNIWQMDVIVSVSTLMKICLHYYLNPTDNNDAPGCDMQYHAIQFQLWL